MRRHRRQVTEEPLETLTVLDGARPDRAQQQRRRLVPAPVGVLVERVVGAADHRARQRQGEDRARPPYIGLPCSATPGVPCSTATSSMLTSSRTACAGT